MGACEQFHDQLWDFLYGLLEGEAAADLCAHAESCGACRQALERARGQQRVLASAARAVDQVPIFQAPGTTTALPASELPVPAPTTLPVDPAPITPSAASAILAISEQRLPVQRRSFRRWALGWTSAAAAVAAAVIGVVVYRNYISERGALAAQVVQDKRDLQKLDSQFAALQTKVEQAEQQAQREKPNGERAQPIHVQVIGPARFHPQAPAALRVVTRDADGLAQSADVHLQVNDAKSGQALYEESARSKGDLTLTVPAGKLTGEKANVVVTAQADPAARVEATLQRAEPSHVTHLTLNKSIYQVGEVVFFRSLTLERFSLQPPTQNVPLSFSLVDANGQSVMELSGQAGEGGIGGGEFALTDDLPSGSYRLQVASGDPRVRGQSRWLEIQRPEAIQVEADRAQYNAGERGNIGLTIRSSNGSKPLPNQPYQARLFVDGKQLPLTQAPGGGAYLGGIKQPSDPKNPPAKSKKTESPASSYAFQSGQTDAFGNAKLQFELPKNIQLGNALVELTTKVGKHEEKIVQPIPVVPSQATIDLFPEGGDLVAGVPNKVYYRVRSPLGEPLDPEGHVIVLTEHTVLYDSERRQGSGWFVFTPDAQENYLVRITGSSGTTEIKAPFQKHDMKADGVVLNVDNPVAKDGEAVNVVVRSTRPERRLLLTLSCRGQMVGQHFFTAGVETPVRLSVAPEVQGVLRLTLYEAAGDRPVPMAERLLYRGVTRQLSVGVTHRQGEMRPGQRLYYKLEVKDETGRHRPAWMLAAVVDERFRAEKNEASLPAFFHLGSEVDGEDLEDMPLVLSDAPQARRDLDVFLGTTGWRRFGPAAQANPTLLAKDDKKDKADDLNKGRALDPVLFSRENQRRGELKQKLQQQERAQQQQEQTQLAELQQQATTDRAGLLAQRDAAAARAQADIRVLDEFDQQWAYRLRQMFWAIVFALTAVGILFLLMTLLALARKRRNNLALVGSFSCLALALLLFLNGRSTEVLDGRGLGEQARLDLRRWPEIRLAQDDQGKEKDGAAKQATAKALPAPPVGYFAAIPPEARKKAAPSLAKEQIKALEMALKEAKVAESENVSKFLLHNNNYSQITREGPDDMLSRRQNANEEMQNLYLEAAKGQTFRNRADQPAGVPLPQDPARKPDVNPPAVPVSPPGPPPINPTTTPNPSKKDPQAGGKGGQGGQHLDQQQQKDMVRFYAHRPIRTRVDLQDTLLWHPTLFTPDGNDEITFALSGNLTTYRFLIYANSPDGRLGFYEGRLEVNKK